MGTSLEKIAEEAASMSRLERLTLVRLLLDLDQPVKGDEIADAWDSEIRARVNVVDDGRVSALSPEDCSGGSPWSRPKPLRRYPCRNSSITSIKRTI